MAGTIYGMRKTTVYLDADVDRALARVAAARGISKAELIRQALRRLIADIEPPQIGAIGVGEGPGDVASDVDRHLTETGFGTR